MQRKSGNPPYHVPVTSSMQITDSHCGPAVVQMLLASIGMTATQEAIAAAGGASETIEVHGMRVDQLAQAVHAVAPEAQFWVKEHATIDDVVTVLNDYKFAVGVEWQGVFESPEEVLEDEDDEDEESDYGHYSIVSYVDLDSGQLIIVDPYKDFVDQDRVFPIEVFERRWWDTNEVTDPQTGEAYLVEDLQLMFVITPITDTFPEELGMKRL